MFQHILVPVDFSERNKQALDIAVKIALLDQGRVTLLHVIEMIAGTTLEEFGDFYTKLEKRAQQEMETLVIPYRDNQVEIESKIVYGNRTPEILKFAAAYNVDLIVMSSHKIDPVDPIQGWGTISYKVGILSPCPVMLVK